MNKKRAFFAVALATTLTVGLVAVTGTSLKTENPFSSKADGDYTLNITDMAQIKNGEVVSTDGNRFTFNVDNFSEAGVLTAGKMLHNYEAFNDLTKVSVTADKTVKILAGWYQGSTSSFAFDEDNPLAEGTGTVVANFATTKASYFAILAGEENATLSSLKIEYPCDTVPGEHTLTVNLFSNNKPADDVNLVSDSNWKVNSEWINDSEDSTYTKMTYVGEIGGYYKYTAEISALYGLMRFQFKTASTSLNVGYDSWKPCSFVLNSDTVYYCYANEGFPSSDSEVRPFKAFTSETSFEYYAVGSFNGWTEQDANYLMTVDPSDSRHYTISGVGIAANGGFKIISNYSEWYGNGGTSDNNNYFVAANGIYTIDFYPARNNSGNCIEITKTGEYNPDISYYVVGSFNGWAQQDANYLMTIDPADANHYTFDSVSIAANGELKVMSSTGVWYGETGSSAGNVKIGDAGNYQIDFYANGNGSGKYIVLTKL